jgi:hypothetical protein
MSPLDLIFSAHGACQEARSGRAHRGGPEEAPFRTEETAAAIQDPWCAIGLCSRAPRSPGSLSLDMYSPSHFPTSSLMPTRRRTRTTCGRWLLPATSSSFVLLFLPLLIHLCQLRRPLPCMSLPCHPRRRSPLARGGTAISWEIRSLRPSLGPLLRTRWSSSRLHLMMNPYHQRISAKFWRALPRQCAHRPRPSRR